MAMPWVATRDGEGAAVMVATAAESRGSSEGRSGRECGGGSGSTVVAVAAARLAREAHLFGGCEGGGGGEGGSG